MKVKKFNESKYLDDSEIKPENINKRYKIYTSDIDDTRLHYSGECDIETMENWYNANINSKNKNTLKFYIEEVTTITKELTEDDFNTIIQQKKYNL